MRTSALLSWMAVVVLLPCIAHAAAIDTYVAAYDKDIAKLKATSGATTFDNDKGELAWSESYVLMSLLDMYRATGRVDYLQLVVADSTRLLQARDDKTSKHDYRGIIAPVWSASSYSDACDASKFKNCNYGWIVQDGMITEPLADFGQLVIRSKQLWDVKDGSGKRFIDIAHTFVSAVAETVSAHEGQWDSQLGVYREQADSPISVAGQVLAYNRYAAMGTTLIQMYLATGDDKYIEKAKALAVYFRSGLKHQADTDAYVWNFASYYPGPEDISHGAIEVNFAYLCYKRGLVFTQEDMQRFANTVAKVFYLGNDGFSPKVDGRRVPDTLKFHMQIGRWIELSEFNPFIYKIVKNHFKTYSGEKAAVTPYPGVLVALAGLALYERYDQP